MISLCLILGLTLGADTGVSSSDLDAYRELLTKSRKACGPTAVFHVLRRTGHPVKLEEVWKQAEIRDDGVSLKELLELARRFGLQGKIVEFSQKDLDKIPELSILIVERKHGIVYEGLADPEHVRFYEPSTGELLTQPRDKLEARWSGKAILFEPPALSPLAFGLIVLSVTGTIVLLAWLTLGRRRHAPQAGLPDARGAFTLLEVLVVIAIIGMLIGLLLSAVIRVRASAARIHCADRLRQLGLALTNYDAQHHRFPPGCSYLQGADPMPHASWMTRLLPFLEHEDLWRQSVDAFEQVTFFQYGPHSKIFSKSLPCFLCPADNRPDTPGKNPNFHVGFTDFLGVEGWDLKRNDGVLFLDSRITAADITDGLSQTLMVGERPPSLDKRFGWWYAGWGQNKTGSLDLTLGVRELRTGVKLLPECPEGPYQFQPSSGLDPCDVFHFWSAHSGGANFLFCDGSVHFFVYSVDPILPALATRAGGEKVTVPD